MISSRETQHSGLGGSEAIRNDLYSVIERTSNGKRPSTDSKPDPKHDIPEQATTSLNIEVPLVNFDSGLGATSHQPRQSMAQRTILSIHGIILGKVIGSGNYAKVKIAYSEELGKRVAVKIISKLKAPIEYTKKFLPREIDAVKGLHHENLIQFYQSIETNHRVYLVMQLAENGTLLDYVRDKKHLEEPLAKELFRQLISALSYIHSKGVVHRYLFIIPH